MDDPDYNPALETPPLDDAELDALDALLLALPGDAAMNVEMLDGYLTALLLAPTPVSQLRSRTWLGAVWGGDGAGHAPFASHKQRKRVVLLVLRHLHSIDRQLRAAPERWEPVFSIAEGDEQELADAEDWCIGFLQAVALDGPGWGPVFDDAALGPPLRPLVLLGGDESTLSADELARIADPHERDALSRAVVDGVLALNARPRG